MDENPIEKHVHSVDRMFDVAHERARERLDSLHKKQEEGRVSQEMLDALEVFLAIALSREGDPDLKKRLHEASRGTLESTIGSLAIRQRAIPAGTRIAISAFRRARLATLKEDMTAHSDESESD